MIAIIIIAMYSYQVAMLCLSYCVVIASIPNIAEETEGKLKVGSGRQKYKQH